MTPTKPRPNPGRKGHNVSDLRRLNEFDIKIANRFWFERIMEGALNTWGGPSGRGKSLATCRCLADVSNGIGMHDGKPINSILSNREDDTGIVRARVEAAGGDLNYIHIPARGYIIDAPGELDRLRNDIVKYDAKLVVFDTAAKSVLAHFSNDQRVAQALDPLTALAHATGCAFLFITHANKSGKRGGDPLMLIGGPQGGLVGSSRCVALFGSNPADEGQRAMVWVKDSYSAPPRGMVFSIDADYVYDDDGEPIKNRKGDAEHFGYLNIEDMDADLDPWDVVLGAKADKDDAPAEKRAEAGMWLVTQLGDGPMPATKLQAEAGLDGVAWGTIRRAAKEAEIDKVKEGFGKDAVTYWRLPAGHPGLNPNTDNKTPGGK